MFLPVAGSLFWSGGGHWQQGEAEAGDKAAPIW